MFFGGLDDIFLIFVALEKDMQSSVFTKSPGDPEWHQKIKGLAAPW